MGDKNRLQVDSWIWGSETIVWGFEPSHQYTCKVLAPKKGRAGCLSLQYHNVKSESWIQFTGSAWALLVIDGIVCTRIMHPGAIQNIPTGTIHRVMGLSDDCRIIEPSTPDRHAADKTKPKDVVRLHCVLGREVSPPRDDKEKKIIEQAIAITEQACKAIEQGEPIIEFNLDLLFERSAGQITL